MKTMVRKTGMLALAALMAGIYFLPLCPNVEMLAGGKIDTAMCAEKSCCAADASPRTPSCCEPTLLTLDRRDGVSVDAPTLFPPSLVPMAFHAALELAPVEFFDAAVSALPSLSPPLSLPLRL